MTATVLDLLQSGVGNGVYVVSLSPDPLELDDELGAADRRLHHVDLRGVQDKAGAIAALRAAVDAPAWAGTNWDAVYDVLTDLSWVPARGHVVWLESPGGLARRAPDVWAAAVRVLADAAAWWADRDLDFHALVHDTDPASGLYAL